MMRAESPSSTLLAALERPAWAVPFAGLLLVTGLLALENIFPEEMTIFPTTEPLPLELKLQFLGAAVLYLLGTRLWPAARDYLNVLFGLTCALYVFNWQYVASMLVLAALIRHTFHLLSPWLAMLLTGALLVATFLTLIPRFSPSPLGAAWTSARLLFYAYELRAIPKKQRSLIALLAYSPFSFPLFSGEPPMMSYLTYRTRRPKEQLDALGSRQLVRSAGKLLLLDFIYVTTPYWGAIPGVSWFIRPYVIFYLVLSLCADFATALSNLSGYYAPDAFDNPFVATTPFDFWRRWNIPFLFFLRQTLIYPLGRRYRSILVSVIAGMVGTHVLHMYPGVVASHRMPDFLWWGKKFAVSVAVFLPFVPVYSRVERWPLPARLVMIAITQVLQAWEFHYVLRV